MKKQRLTVILLSILFLYFLFSDAVSLYQLTKWKDAPTTFWIRSVLSFLILIIGCIGLLQYHFSAYRYSKLLRLYLSFCCFQYPLYLITSLLTFFHLRAKYNIPSYSIITPLVIFLSAVICFYTLFIINKARKPQFIFYESDALTYAQFEPVSHSTRFLNRIIDVGVILFFIYSFYESIKYFFIWDSSFRSTLTPGYIYIFIIILYFFYYFFLEALFKITIGKIITDTTVVNEEGANASLSQILARTFSRFIPFEPLSFLFDSRGWHDSISNTYVIKERYDWEPDKTII